MQLQSFGSPGLQFDDINDVPFTTLLALQVAGWLKAHHLFHHLQ